MGHSENGIAVSTAGVSISVFRMDYIKKSYTYFIETVSKLAIERHRLGAVHKLCQWPKGVGGEGFGKC